MRLLHILTVSALFFLPKPASASHIPDYEQQLFIETWGRLAVKQMELYGIPASIILAQAIVESGWGKGSVATSGNNYFCIKANNGWAGPVIKFMDDEEDSSSFRKYLNIEESFTDHSKFLRENMRYQPLFQLNRTDYRAWSYGLKACGYATKGDYAEQLIATIEKYGLYLYDAAALGEQMKLLDLPYGATGEVDQDTVPQPSFHPPLPKSEEPSKVEDGEQPLLKVPGYQLGSVHTPSATTKPSAGLLEAHVFMKIPLILPKAAPKFERR